MKYLFIILLFPCCRKETLEQETKQMRLIRVAAVDNDESTTYTFIQKITTGIAVVEFSVAKPVNVNHYQIEISKDDGKTFSPVKTLVPNKTNYRDTITIK